MAAMSDWLENQIIDHIFRTGSFTKPSALFVALFTAAPTDSGGGTEVAAASYARVQRDPLDANWDATSGSDGKTANSAIITFPTPAENWGTIVAIGVFDASTGGNLLFHMLQTPNKTVNNGDTAPSFAVGALTFTLA